jgi:hypothetical protein
VAYSPRAVKAEVLLSARDIATDDLSFSVRFESIGPVETCYKNNSCSRMMDGR